MRKRWFAALAAVVAVPIMLVTAQARAAVAPAAGGVYTLVPGAGGTCVQAPSTASGALLVQAACATGNTAQQWKVVTAGSGYFLSNVPSGATTSNLQLQQYASTVQAAVDAAANNSMTTIKAGTYREIVTLRGPGASASQVVIVHNHSSAGGYGASGSATVFVNGPDFTATNLTMANDYGEGSQAVAANLNGDRGVYDNVRFLGNQDTLLVNRNRHYVVNS